MAPQGTRSLPWTHPWLAELLHSSILGMSAWGRQERPRDHPLGYLLWISHSRRKQSPEWRIPLPEPGRAPGSRFVSRLAQEQLLPYLRHSSCFAPGIPSPPPLPLSFPLWSGPFGAGIMFLDSLPCLAKGCGSGIA